jgi:DNA-nicking Smr family endonuclease
MDFGEILERWERGRCGGAPIGRDAKSEREAVRKIQCDYLDTHPIIDKDAATPTEESHSQRNAARHRLRDAPPEATLDLHKKNATEAWRLLTDFFQECSERNLSKVLIIHGKGNHSKKGGLLKDVCRFFLEQCSEAGETGHPDERNGGEGATWVILRNAPKL